MKTANRHDFLVACKALERCPYIWGGKDPSGIDCSGLVTWAYKVAGGEDIRSTHNSDFLWAILPDTPNPRAGDLVFYGTMGDPCHVMVCLGDKDSEVIGASGGNKDTNCYEAATRMRAQVKRKPSPHYRPDVIGFRSTHPWFGD